MRFRIVSMGMALGAGLITSAAANAVGSAEYTAEKNKLSVIPLSQTANSPEQFPSQAGQIFEAQGVVSGIFSGNGNTGFLLRVSDSQTLIISAAKNDPDITVGSTLRVLARVPQSGTVFEGLTVTTMGQENRLQEMANAQTAVREDAEPDYTGFDQMPMPQTPTFRYYQAPEFPQQPQQNEAPAPVINAQTPLSAQPQVVAMYAQRIQQINGDVSDNLANEIAYHILDKSERYGVDPRLVFALVTQESRFNPHARSYVGAQGLGQLMPGTAAHLGVHDPYDVADNLDGTIRYLADQLDHFGRLSLALAAYNAGPGNVNKYGGVPPFRETRNYVSTIWKHYAKLTGVDPTTGQRLASTD